eukprot:jgi/Ulvmu1/4851/UM020_0137.1
MRHLHKLPVWPYATVALQASARTLVALGESTPQFSYKHFCWQSGGRGARIERARDAKWWGGVSGDLTTSQALAQHANTDAPLSNQKQASPEPSDKVTARHGRGARMLDNPFQGLREPRSCLRIMSEGASTAGLMQRVVGLHSLQKSVYFSSPRFKASPEDLSTVMLWLMPLTLPGPRPSGRGQPASPRLYELRWRGASMLLYSFASLLTARSGWQHLLDKPGMQSLQCSTVTHVSSLVHQLDPQAVSNTLYAAARLGISDGRLITGLTLAADRLAPHMDAQHLANSLWALASLDVGLPDTITALLVHLGHRQANAVDVSSALWALARLQCLPPADLQEPVAQIVMRMLRPLPAIQEPAAAVGHISTFSPRQLATAVWSLSSLNLHSGPLYDIAAPLLIRSMAASSDKALSMAAATYSRPAVQERSRLALPLLRAVLCSLRERIVRGSCIPDVIADTVWQAWRGCAADTQRRAVSPSGRSSLMEDSLASTPSTLSTGASQREATEARTTKKFDQLVAASQGRKPITQVGGKAVAHAGAGQLGGAEPGTAQLASADLAAVRRALSAAVSSLGECQPQVAERLIGCMGKTQLARLATVAYSLPGVGGEAVQRVSGAVQRAVPELCAADVLQLCDAVATSAHSDGRAVMALAAHLMGGSSGVAPSKADAALRAFHREGFMLPVEVQGRLDRDPSARRFQLCDVMGDLERQRAGRT